MSDERQARLVAALHDSSAVGALPVRSTGDAGQRSAGRP